MLSLGPTRSPSARTAQAACPRCARRHPAGRAWPCRSARRRIGRRSCRARRSSRPAWPGCRSRAAACPASRRNTGRVRRREATGPARRRDPGVVLRRAGQVDLAAVYEIVRVLLDPRVIRGHVVRNEIEHQPQTALLQTLAQPGQRGIASQSGVHDVAGDRKSGTRDVLLAQVRQRLLELLAPFADWRARSAARPARSATRSATRSSRTPCRRDGPARRPECRPAWPACPGIATARSARRAC